MHAADKIKYSLDGFGALEVVGVDMEDHSEAVLDAAVEKASSLFWEMEDDFSLASFRFHLFLNLFHIFFLSLEKRFSWFGWLFLIVNESMSRHRKNHKELGFFFIQIKKYELCNRNGYIYEDLYKLTRVSWVDVQG